MLRPQPERDDTPADTPMVGKCWTCGTIVKCLRSQCVVKTDPSGSHVCAECPHKTGGRTQIRNLRGVLVEVDAICGAKVRMGSAKVEGQK